MTRPTTPPPAPLSQAEPAPGPLDPTPERVFQGVRIWQISPALLVAATTLLADAERPHRPDLIVGITRGGGPVAAAIADRMGVPHVLVGARHNTVDSIAVAATGIVTLDETTLLPEALTQPLAGQAPARLLLVDDICGTGATITTVRSALHQALGRVVIRVAALCRNTGAAFVPDSWIWEVSDWTVFPWENRTDPPGKATELLPIPTEVRHP